MNPRSIYNKTQEFHSLVEEREIDLICMSESWEKDSQRLTDIIKLQNFEVISRFEQREKNKVGGQPAFIVSNEKFYVKELMPNIVPYPEKLEIVWCQLTPKNDIGNIKQIIVASIYCKPRAKTKSKLLDHISATYMMMKSKYPVGCFFLLAGDTNDLKLDRLIDLSPNMKNVVRVPTRLIYQFTIKNPLQLNLRTTTLITMASPQITYQC